jgi:hypothetical protein
MKYAGLDGTGRMKELLLSFIITESMVGLSSTFS